MKGVKMQQIIVSGVGGQGVLFITRLMAETALKLGYSILVSETHGMAQRGSIVISHLKIFSRDSFPPFTSPLIRPQHADILLGLHPDSMDAHGFFLREDGKAYCNSNDGKAQGVFSVDATAVAAALAFPLAANLVLLGFASAGKRLFCLPEHLADTLGQLGGKRLPLSLKALEAGRKEGELFFEPIDPPEK